MMSSAIIWHPLHLWSGFPMQLWAGLPTESVILLFLHSKTTYPDMFSVTIPKMTVTRKKRTEHHYVLSRKYMHPIWKRLPIIRIWILSTGLRIYSCAVKRLKFSVLIVHSILPVSSVSVWIKLVLMQKQLMICTFSVIWQIILERMILSSSLLQETTCIMTVPLLH